MGLHWSCSCTLMCYVGAEAWNIERIIEHVPADAEIIQVTGQQWLWTFEHEDGTKEIGELHLEKGKAYKFEVTSKDVIHSFNIHDYTVLMDAVPGRVNQFGFHQLMQVNSQFNVENIVG